MVKVSILYLLKRIENTLNRLLTIFMFQTHFRVILLLLFSVFQLLGKPVKLKSYQVGQVHLTGYLPVDQQVNWVRKRPICHPGQSLIVPAAFTQTDLSIVGASIDWGKIINSHISQDLSGFCLIEQFKPQILNSNQLNKAKIVQLATVGRSLFQQDLIVQDGHSLPISHAASLNLWRVLVIFSDRFEVVENDVKMRRDDFQSALLKIGARQAIYLDMGTWSEGSYWSAKNRVVKFGKMRQNTRKQTNWLVFH